MEISTAFSTEEIKEQAGRILSFPSFKNSPVLSRFLEFVISETLEKRELHIKEYSIAIQVLDRTKNFNPSVDSIVRIHAGRLRRALTDYYLTQGIYDPIIIQIPKGGYVPEFKASGTAEVIGDQAPLLRQKGNKPVVAIFPFKIITPNEDIDKLNILLEGQLSEVLLKFRDIVVIGYYSAELEVKIKENVLEAGKSAGADYIIAGNLTCIGEDIRVLINLLVTSTGEVLLCKSFDRIILPSAIVEIRNTIVENYIGFAEGCYRFINQDRLKSA